MRSSFGAISVFPSVDISFFFALKSSSIFLILSLLIESGVSTLIAFVPIDVMSTPCIGFFEGRAKGFFYSSCERYSTSGYKDFILSSSFLAFVAFNSASKASDLAIAIELGSVVAVVWSFVTKALALIA